jgi:hypothetical protein
MQSSRSGESIKAKREPAALVVRRAFSRRATVNEFQVQHLCGLCRLLVRSALDLFEVEAYVDLPEQGWESFTQMPEYRLFTSGVYACGFVCSDLSPTVDLGAVDERPGKALADLDLSQLRHYMHTLMRSERAGFGYGSVLYEAVRSGALDAFSERLERDADLYEDL